MARCLIFRRDTLIARYAKTVQIWGTRFLPDDHHTYHIDERGVHLADRKKVEAFTGSEVNQLLSWARDLVGEEELDAAREELTSGGDGLLQLLVIASCPNLESVRFVRRRELLHEGCRYWLFKTIQHLTKLDDGPSYPVGLRILQDIAFGVDAGIVEEYLPVASIEQQPEWVEEHELACLLKLPSLTTLYYFTATTLGNLWLDLDQNRSSPPAMEVGASNIRHIFLDEVPRIEGKYRESLTAAFRELQSFAIRLRPEGFMGFESFPDSNQLMEHLAEYQGGRCRNS